jgi:hypothetical protein
LATKGKSVELKHPLFVQTVKEKEGAPIAIAEVKVLKIIYLFNFLLLNRLYKFCISGFLGYYLLPTVAINYNDGFVNPLPLVYGIQAFAIHMNAPKSHMWNGIKIFLALSMLFMY